jgi:ferritin-like metal-binding protein YciE
MSNNQQKFYTLNNLLLEDVKIMINGEKELKLALVEWISTATSLKLKNILHYYHQFVDHHIENLDFCFPNGKTNGGIHADLVMKNLIQTTKDKIEKCFDAEVKDACLLASIQKIIHVKICLYGTAKAFAKALEIEKYVTVFKEAENNEKQIDQKLSLLAEKEINIIAKSPILIES